jgi:ribosomal-protein-serine acetyltransferase
VNIAIRPYKIEDAADLVEAVLESLEDFRPSMGWAHSDYGHDEAHVWIAAQIAAAASGDAHEFVITDERGHYLGGCGVNQIQQDLRVGNLGYWVRTSAAGRGVAVRAVHLLADWAFTKTNLERVEILCAVGNLRSQRVADKAGAEHEGTLRARLRVRDEQHDAVVYAIVRNDWN